MTYISYTGKKVAIGAKYADYVLPFVNLSAPLPYLGFDEFGQSCTNTGNTITVTSNTSWTVTYPVVWLGGDLSGTGDGFIVVSCAPDEGGPGRGDSIIVSGVGCADKTFGCTQLSTGQTCT